MCSRILQRSVLALAFSLSVVACGEDDPTSTPTPDAGNGVTDAGNANPDAGNAGLPIDDDFGASCALPTEDYAPGADDDWAACDPDDGVYRTIEAQVSSIGRIAAYESMADLLWRTSAPGPDAFLDARELYATDEGLDSRVQRREDEHYPPVTNADGETLRCRDEGVPAMDPDRCVGPAQILPILNDAFVAGAQGEDPDINAARIDAALLWFLYVSSHKEAITCTQVAKDCDSAWAYFTGGTQRGEGLGLSAVMADASPAAYDRAFDGALAVRCWRDLDSGEEATNIALRDAAVTQYDEAMLFGLSEMLVDRLAVMSGQSGVERAASWVWIQILGNVLVRDMTERDAAAASSWSAILAGDSPADVDTDAAIALLRGGYACPSAP